MSVVGGKSVKSLSNVKEENLVITDSMSLVAGNYSNVNPSEMLIFCDTTSGDITLSGFSSGVVGQSITIVKNSSDNNLILLHENGSTKPIRTHNKKTVTVSPGYYSKITLYCDGSYWYCGEVDNSEGSTGGLSVSTSVSSMDIVELVSTGVRKFDINNYYNPALDDAVATSGSTTAVFESAVMMFENMYVGIRRYSSNNRLYGALFCVGKDNKVIKGVDQSLIASAVGAGSVTLIKLKDGMVYMCYSRANVWYVRLMYLSAGVLTLGTELSTGVTLAGGRACLELVHDDVYNDVNNTGTSRIFVVIGNTTAVYAGVYEQSLVPTVTTTNLVAMSAITSTVGTPSISGGVSVLNMGAGKLLIVVTGSVNTTASLWELSTNALVVNISPIIISRDGNSVYALMLTGNYDNKIVYACMGSTGKIYVGGIYYNISNSTLTNISMVNTGFTGLTTKNFGCFKYNPATMGVYFSVSGLNANMFNVFIDEDSTSLSFVFSSVVNVTPTSIVDDFTCVWDRTINTLVCVYGDGTLFRATVNRYILNDNIIGVSLSSKSNGSVDIALVGYGSRFSGLVAGVVYYVGYNGRLTRIKTDKRMLVAASSTSGVVVWGLGDEYNNR